jgi:hypothetical protein
MDLELASGPANEEAQRSFAKHKVREIQRKISRHCGGLRDKKFLKKSFVEFWGVI